MSNEWIHHKKKLLSISALVVILALFVINTFILFRPEAEPQNIPVESEEGEIEPAVQVEQTTQEPKPQENKKLVPEVEQQPQQKATYAYIVNQQDNTIAKVNLATRRVISTIIVGPRPSDAAIAQDRLYVISMDASALSIIDLNTHALLETIELENTPEALALYKNKVFVTDSKEDAVRAIDLASKKIAKILVGKKPRAFFLEPVKEILLVANFETNDVTLINPNINVALNDIDLSGKGPVRLAVSPQKDYLYVVNELTNDVSIVPYKFVRELQRETTRIQVGSRPLRIAFTPDGRYALVTNFYEDSISVISTQQQRVIRSINVGSSPYDIAIDKNGKYAYVTEYVTGTLAIIDLATFKKIGDINVGNAPVRILLHDK